MTKRSDDTARARATVSVSSLMSDARQSILARVTPEQLERMHHAEQARKVYAAWNTVCGGTREGEHVTGLQYLSDENKLLVYLDSAAWTQEMTMLREIIRARMERVGVVLNGFVFRTSKPGFKRSNVERPQQLGAPRQRGAAAPGRTSTPPHEALSADEERALDDAVAPIEDVRLRKSLKSAMKASFEWKKGLESQNRS